MKKRLTLFLVAVFVCATNLFAARNTRVLSEKISVMTGYTTLEMDLASYGNTVYEAVLAMDDTDVTNGTPIFINKYVDNVYDSTMRIDLEEFRTWQFQEMASHYDFLKLYAIAPDELILTVYYSFSTNRFVFFRIKDGKVVLSKGYSLKNQDAYETQRYAFNGKDRIYVAFDGDHDGQDTNWDLFLLSFDLEGNIVNSVTIFTKWYDVLTGLAASGDSVYFSMQCDPIFSGRSAMYEKHLILQFSKDLEYSKYWAFKYNECGIRSWNIDADAENLVVTVFKESDNVNYHARYSSDGDFICCYEENVVIEAPSYDGMGSDAVSLFTKKKISADGIRFFGQEIPMDFYSLFSNSGSSKVKRKYIDYFVDWKGNKIFEREYKENDTLDLKDYVYVGGGFADGENLDDVNVTENGSSGVRAPGVTYFCSGEDVYTADGIGHVAYTYLIGNEYKETDYVTFEKSDYNPLAVPADSGALADYNSDLVFWEENLVVDDEVIPDWQFEYTVQIICLDLEHVRPDSPEVLDGIPLFSFSER